MAQKVESWQVMAMSDEFYRLCQDMPECATASSVSMGGRKIEGAKCILKASSMEEIKQNLPALIKQLTDAEHTHLHVVHKSGWCYTCKEGKDVNVASNDCPHIVDGLLHEPALCKSWTIDTKKLQAT